MSVSWAHCARVPAPSTSGCRPARRGPAGAAGRPRPLGSSMGRSRPRSLPPDARPFTTRARAYVGVYETVRVNVCVCVCCVCVSEGQLCVCVHVRVRERAGDRRADPRREGGRGAGPPADGPLGRRWGAERSHKGLTRMGSKRRGVPGLHYVGGSWG